MGQRSGTDIWDKDTGQIYGTKTVTDIWDKDPGQIYGTKARDRHRAKTRDRHMGQRPGTQGQR